MTEFATWTQDAFITRMVDREQLMFRWASLRKPLVAALNGLCHGGGAILATCADIRVGCDRAEFRFTAIHGDMTNNTWQLPKAVGLPLATEYILTGRVVSSSEARSAGLFNHFVEAENVLPKAIELAAEIASHPPLGVMESKRLIRESVVRTFEDAFNAENAVAMWKLRPTLENEHIQWWLNRTATN
jgi:enoyl-CoA hydratase/carnithine racemase